MCDRVSTPFVSLSGHPRPSRIHLSLGKAKSIRRDSFCFAVYQESMTITISQHPFFPLNEPAYSYHDILNSITKDTLYANGIADILIYFTTLIKYLYTLKRSEDLDLPLFISVIVARPIEEYHIQLHYQYIYICTHCNSDRDSTRTARMLIGLKTVKSNLDMAGKSVENVAFPAPWR